MPPTATPKAKNMPRVEKEPKEPATTVMSKAAPSTPVMEPPKETSVEEVGDVANDVLTIVSSEEEG